MPQENSIETRRRILAAAAELFSENGFRATSVDSIANACRLNSITIYRYFPKKNELFWEAIDYRLRSSELIEQLLVAMNESATPHEFVERAIASVISTLDREPTLAKLVFFTALELEAQWEMLRKVYLKPFMQVLMGRIENWKHYSKIRPIKAETVAISMVGIIASHCVLNQLLGMELSQGHASTETLATEFADVCATGISAISDNI